MNEKSILIVSYVFPPSPGIGGRRWAKFAKELAKRGFHVFILCSKNPFETTSEWINDVINNDNITVITVPSRYPKHLLIEPKTILEKILYRLSLFFQKSTVKANYYDRASRWKIALSKQAMNIMALNNIQHIIVSGSPFHAIHHISELIGKYSQKVKLIADFRDPWMNNPHFFGIGLLNKTRLQQEKKMEEEVIERSDIVVSVSQEMNDYFIKEYAVDSGKFRVIGNGYDPEDFIGIKPQVNPVHEKIRFIFAGTLYQNTEYLFVPFLNALSRFKVQKQIDYSNMEFNFYGGYPSAYISLLEKMGVDNVHFHGHAPLKYVYQIIAESDICMLFLQKHLSYSLSTKFYEYLALKKKILLFTNPGNTADFITQNRLGYAAYPDSIEKTLVEVRHDFQHGNRNIPDTFPIEQYSVQTLTDKLVQLF